MNDFRFVLLMRHAKHGTGRAPAEESPTDSHLREIALPLGNLTTTSNPPSQTSAPAQGELSDDGKIETEAVAQRVKEYTGEWGEPLKVVAIFHADSAEAKATAVIVHQEFSDATLQKADCLTPKIAFDTEVFKKGDAPKLTKQLKQDVIATAARIKSADNPGNAILLVGHQPLLGWLSHAFAGEAHPIANSEMLCLDLTKPSSGLRWAVSPSDPEAVVELKEKIKSKMDVAKLLASFLGAGLSFLLSTMANKDVDLILGSNMWAFAVGSVFLLVALGFFLWTMCSYDTLLMPHRMWAETPRGRSERPAWVVARPPSLVHWILYQNMVRIWQWQFLPATGLMLAGLSMLFSAVFGARLLETVVADCINLFLIVLVVVVLVLKTWRHFGEVVSACKCPGISSKIRHLCAPWLGSED